MTNLITNIFIQIKAHLIPIQQLIYLLTTYLLFNNLFTFYPLIYFLHTYLLFIFSHFYLLFTPLLFTFTLS